MVHDRLNEALVLELLDSTAGEGAVDLKTLHNSGDGNKLHLGHIGEELLVSGLLEEDGVEGLFADLALGPLLLLALVATGEGGLGLGLLRLLLLDRL